MGGRRRASSGLVLAGAILVVLAVLWQAFSIAAYFRGGGSDWLDAHRMGSLVVHAGQLASVVGAIAAAGRSWRAAGAALAFLAVAVVQILAVGDTDSRGGWVHGFHGLLALVVVLGAVAYAQWSARTLRQPATAVGCVNRISLQTGQIWVSVHVPSKGLLAECRR